MPARIYEAIRYRDSLIHVKDTSYLIEKGYMKIVKDTMDIDEEDDTETLDKLKKSKQKENLITDTIPSQKNDADIRQRLEATLPDKQRKPNNTDTVK
jgi:hypothetical protein